METRRKVCLDESPQNIVIFMLKCYIRMAFKALVCFVRFKLEANPLNGECFHTEEVNNYSGSRG